jgi:hypothetical protein
VTSRYIRQKRQIRRIRHARVGSTLLDRRDQEGNLIALEMIMLGREANDQRTNDQETIVCTSKAQATPARAFAAARCKALIDLREGLNGARNNRIATSDQINSRMTWPPSSTRY